MVSKDCSFPFVKVRQPFPRTHWHIQLTSCKWMSDKSKLSIFLEMLTSCSRTFLSKWKPQIQFNCQCSHPSPAQACCRQRRKGTWSRVCSFPIPSPQTAEGELWGEGREVLIWPVFLWTSICSLAQPNLYLTWLFFVIGSLETFLPFLRVSPCSSLPK